MRERVIAEINLDKLIYNYNEIKKFIPENTEIMAVVKADAYGHGAVTVAKALQENGISKFAVATIDEAVELRKSYINGDILILGYFEETKYEDLILNEISQTIFSYSDAKKLSGYAETLGKKAKVHIKIDTGMNRIGFKYTEDIIEDVKKICKLPLIDVDGVFTHFATADFKDKAGVLEQINRYNEVISKLQNEGITFKLKHILNSAAAIDLGMNYSMDFVRTGITLYGLLPSHNLINKINLKEIMCLKSKVVWIKDIDIGESVSYDATFTAKRRTKVATIPVGYADGYPRNLSNKGRVLVNGQYANIIGKICMDQFMIDISDIEDVKIGDEVILFGEQNGKQIAIDEIADKVDTINYEIVCGITKRVPRIYIGCEM